MDRRTLLQGFGTAALLAPFLAVERAAAQRAGQPATDHIQHPDPHEGLMRVPGLRMHGTEHVAMLLYPGFTALDLVGPHYFFACMMGATVHLVTPGAAGQPVGSDLGLAIQPTATLDSTPRDLDILFVPGGTSGTLEAMANSAVVDWVRDRGARARHVTSVCTGSMLLGKASLLRGKRATSHWITRPLLGEFGATPVDERVVRDGNVTTGAGVTAGIDFAIALVAAIRGEPYAQALMLQAEYDPEPPLPGGTVTDTPPIIAGPMQEMFAPLQQRFRAAARASRQAS